MFRKAFVLFFLVLTIPVYAQKIKTVVGEYTYHAPENITIEEAKHTALSRARIQALIDEFGLIVSQTNSTRIETGTAGSKIDFNSVGGSDVKGEWIETIGEPEYTIIYEGNMLIVSVKVKGKAREILSSGINFVAKILKNGIEDKFESDNFRNGDDLFLAFQSPVAGYLTIYLVDNDQQAFCLLPYSAQTDGVYTTKANKRYLLFHSKYCEEKDKGIVDEYTMTCEHDTEHNELYIIFSPNKFFKAIDQDAEGVLPRSLKAEDFHHWIGKCRRHDADMSVKLLPITINRQ